MIEESLISRVLSLLLAMSSLCCLGRARAEGLAIALEAPRDSDCISQAELTQRVVARVGAEGLAQSVLDRRIEVRITRAAANGFQAVLQVVNSAQQVLGSRALTEERDCRALDDALVVIVSTLVGVQSEAAPAVPHAAPLPAPRAPVAADEPKSTPAVPARSRVTARLFHLADGTHARARYGLVLGPVLTTGVHPTASWGAFAGGVLQWRALYVALALLALPRSHMELGEGATARFSSVLGRLLGCVDVSAAEGLRGGPCVGLQGGALRVATHGLGETQKLRAAAANVELGARIALPVSARSQLSLALLAMLPVLNHRYVLLERDEQRRVTHTSEPGVLVELAYVWLGSS